MSGPLEIDILAMELDQRLPHWLSPLAKGPRKSIQKRQAQHRSNWLYEKGRAKTRDKEAFVEAEHPRNRIGEFARKFNAAFVSPNTGEVDFDEAEHALHSRRQEVLLNASEEIDEALGLKSKQTSIIGAWSDGAENSVMTTYDTENWDKIVAAAVMKGYLAEQKAILAFRQNDAGQAAIYCFHAKGSLDSVHAGLLEDGLAFHSLVPTDDGAEVYIVDTDGSLRDAVDKGAARYDAEVEFEHGDASFIGDADGSGTDADQRSRARRAYGLALETSPVPQIGEIWRRSFNAYRSAFESTHDAFSESQVKRGGDPENAGRFSKTRGTRSPRRRTFTKRASLQVQAARPIPTVPTSAPSPPPLPGAAETRGRSEAPSAAKPSTPIAKIAPGEATAAETSKTRLLVAAIAAGKKPPKFGRELIADVSTRAEPNHLSIVSPRYLKSYKVEPKNNPDYLKDKSSSFLDVDMATYYRYPDKVKHNVGIIKGYGIMPRAETKKMTPVQFTEAFIDHMANNLVWIYDSVPKEIRDRSAAWYYGARDMVDKWTATYNFKDGVKSDAVIAGVLANLSPQTDWFTNIEQAKQVLDIVVGTKGKTPPFETHAFDEKMAETFKKFSFYVENKKIADGKKTGDQEKARAKKKRFDKILEEMIGKRGVQVESDVMQRYYWIRAYAETYCNRTIPLMSPEGQVLGVVTNKDGTPTKLAWGNGMNIKKAFNCIRSSGSAAEISQLVGFNHKVRCFYNNILAPNNMWGIVTIDTHAAAAATLKMDKRIAENAMGTSSKKGVKAVQDSDTSGLGGLYSLYTEAYRRAAKARKIAPNQMQSIVWEAIRGLYTDDAKTEKNENRISLIWMQYAHGTRTLAETRNAIFEHLGQKDFGRPKWA